MAKRAGLRSRLDRLERRQVRPEFPRLVFRLCEQEEAGEIVGFNVGASLYVPRLAGETKDDCATRAFALSPSSPCIFAVHANRPERAAERDSGGSRAPTPR
jgi:hypothetical protein